MYKILKITLLGFHKISQPCYLSYNVFMVSGKNSGKKEFELPNLRKYKLRM